MQSQVSSRQNNNVQQSQFQPLIQASSSQQISYHEKQPQQPQFIQGTWFVQQLQPPQVNFSESNQGNINFIDIPNF